MGMSARLLLPRAALPIFYLFLLLTIIDGSNKKESEDLTYAGDCSIYDPQKIFSFDFDCHTALFSRFNYRTEGVLHVVSDGDLCSFHPNDRLDKSSINANVIREIQSSIAADKKADDKEVASAEDGRGEEQEDEYEDEYEDEEHNDNKEKRAHRDDSTDATAATATTTVEVIDVEYMHIAAVLRGNCSFETKVKNAALRGFDALIIINTDATAFPAGAASHLYKSSIPCVMASSKFIPAYQNLAGISDVCVPPPPTVGGIDGLGEGDSSSFDSTTMTDASGNATDSSTYEGSNGEAVEGGDASAVYGAIDKESGAIADLRRQLAEQEKMLKAMMDSLVNKTEDNNTDTNSTSNNSTNSNNSNSTDTNSTSTTTVDGIILGVDIMGNPIVVTDEAVALANGITPQDVRYCKPGEIPLVATPKVVFVSLKYTKGLTGYVEEEEDQGEQGETVDPDVKKKKKKYFRLIVVVALLALTSGLTFVGMSLFSLNMSYRDLQTKIAPIVTGLFPFAVLFSAFIVLRFGTFRVMSVDHIHQEYVYNHNETDEHIFETLIRIIEKNLPRSLWNPRYYTIAKYVEEMRLAPENYSDKLFIHPPFFVYTAAILKYLFGLPIPGYALLSQILTMGLLPVLVYSVSGLLNADRPMTRFQQMTNGVCLWAIVIFSSCPIAAFCSQKIWIDNALLLASTAAAVGHFTLVSIPRALPQFSFTWGAEQVPTKNHVMNYERVLELRKTSMMRHFMSGFVFFGGIALNCKITALAMLPFLIAWSALQRVITVMSEKAFNITAIRPWLFHVPFFRMSQPISVPVNIVVEDLILHWSAFLIGAVLSHGPWILMYRSFTGRWLPNAWPSPTMIERSTYIQTALSKPWHSYLSSMLRVSPIHLVGLALGVFTLIIMVYKLYARLLAGGWILSLTTAIHVRVDRVARKIAANRLAAGWLKMLSRRVAMFTGALVKRVDAHTEVPLIEEKTVTSKQTPEQKLAEANILMLQGKQQLDLLELLQSVEMRVAVFALWPIGYILGLSVLGCCGAGFQTRFLLPALPATTVLAATYIAPANQGRVTSKVDKDATVVSQPMLGGDSAAAAVTTRSAVCAMLLCYGALHMLFYGVLFAPLFADLDYSVVGVIAGIMRSQYTVLDTREKVQMVFKFMEHFGLSRSIA